MVMYGGLGDSLSLEMAADELCAALRVERPAAEDAFRRWFAMRHPLYAA